MDLRTERLLLRPFQPTDVPSFERFTTEAAYRQHLGEDHPAPDVFVANNLGLDGSWVIELDGVVVGSVFLGEELACLLDPKVHHRGFGLEATAAIVTDGFERRSYTEIVARADPANVASRRVLAHLGFNETGAGSFLLRRQDWQRGSHSGHD
jgi:RimJ/RimL family protein N-acetyltransferase